VVRHLFIILAACIGVGLPEAAPAARFERLAMPDGAGPPVEIGIWSPEGDAKHLPLVVISHGTGGDFRSHQDTAQALADAGFVVAAPTHPGDNWRDTSRTFAVWQRPRHLKMTIDHVLQRWGGRGRIDPGRIGAFGFSAGGFTVLVAAGGDPQLARIRGHCRANPRFFDCSIAPNAPIELLGPIEWVHDDRIRAVVVAAPALGFTFGAEGLTRVTQPMQLWRAERDQVLPHPFYAEAVRTALPRQPEYRVVPQAGHFDFLKPCSPGAAAARPELCGSAPGFDRARFHHQMNEDIIRFFRRTLSAPGPRRRGLTGSTGSAAVSEGGSAFRTLVPSSSLRPLTGMAAVLARIARL
jgi:predicted dienelactone hydrolase